MLRLLSRLTEATAAIPVRLTSIDTSIPIPAIDSDSIKRGADIERISRQSSLLMLRNFKKAPSFNCQIKIRSGKIHACSTISCHANGYKQLQCDSIIELVVCQIYFNLLSIVIHAPVSFTDIPQTTAITKRLLSARARAKKMFRQFNEAESEDECLDEDIRRRLTDEEGRREIEKIISLQEMIKIKSMPKEQRDQLIKRIKDIEGISQRQAVRILGVTPKMVDRA